MTVADYCVGKPNTKGCEIPCCIADIANCNACKQGISVDDFCARNPNASGCKPPCCNTPTADCLAC